MHVQEGERKNSTLPWVEKYRPKLFNEFQGQDQILNTSTRCDLLVTSQVVSQI